MASISPYNLVQWLTRSVTWSKYSYYRLSQPALLDAKDLDESMVNMITLLYKQNNIGPEQFNQASTRFNLTKTNI